MSPDFALHHYCYKWYTTEHDVTRGASQTLESCSGKQSYEALASTK